LTHINIPQYTALLLDADETLFDFLTAERQAFTQLVESFGYPCSDGMYARYHEVNRACWKRLERGEITKVSVQFDRFTETFREFGYAVDPVEASHRYREMLADCSILLPGALDAVRALSGCFRLVIVTNGVLTTQTKRFHASAIRPYIAAMHVSDEVGYPKPDRRFFDTVLKREGLRADECLVVGDSLTSDILGAYNAGIDAVWVDASRSGTSTTALASIASITELPGLLGLL
jgi:2-haloacid dehalogenase